MTVFCQKCERKVRFTSADGLCAICYWIKSQIAETNCPECGHQMDDFCSYCGFKEIEMSERVLDVGTQKHTKVICTDEPALGSRACHEYDVVPADGGSDKDCFAAVHFQNGPVKEEGVNGCHNEDLIAIVIDRLLGFQSGEFACEANAKAVAHLASAMDALRSRTDERESRGVEGTNVV